MKRLFVTCIAILLVLVNFSAKTEAKDAIVKFRYSKDRKSKIKKLKFKDSRQLDAGIKKILNAQFRQGYKCSVYDVGKVRGESGDNLQIDLLCWKIKP